MSPSLTLVFHTSRTGYRVSTTHLTDPKFGPSQEPSRVDSGDVVSEKVYLHPTERS